MCVCVCVYSRIIFIYIICMYLCLYLCKRRHGRIMTPRLKPFEKGTIQKAAVFVKNAIFISLTHVHVSLSRIYILYYSLLAIEPRIYIICADSLDYTSKLGVCMCNDPLYYSDSRRAIHILNIFSSSIFFYYYYNMGVYYMF